MSRGITWAHKTHKLIKGKPFVMQCLQMLLLALNHARNGIGKVNNIPAR